MQDVYTLFSASAATKTAGDAIKLDVKRFAYGSIAVQVHGNPATPFSGAVKLQGTNSTDQAVREGTCVWSDIYGMTWTDDEIKALTVCPTHIRGYVGTNTNGNLTMTISS